jgi:hypothetical protein
MLLIAEIDQRVQPVDRLGPDIAAAAAIAAIGPAMLDEFLAAEADRTAAAAAGAQVDLRKIEKLHGVTRGPAPPGPPSSWQKTPGSVRGWPLTSGRQPFSPNA